MSKIAVIGGTGFSELVRDYVEISTDYGRAAVGSLRLGGKDVDFISRHRELEAPHLVNYKANIQALKLRGVDKIYAVSACGRFYESVQPGHLGVVTDIDWDDVGGPQTFAEPGLIMHISMNPALSNVLNKNLIDSWNEVHNRVCDLYQGTSLRPGFHGFGTYFNIRGPSFSTSAREERLRGCVKHGRYIGMTVVHEAHLAREMGMAYSVLAMVVDHSNFPGAPKVVEHKDGVMMAVEKTAKAAVLVVGNAVRCTPDDLRDPVCHGSMARSIHPSQVDLARIVNSGRRNLADIVKSGLGLSESNAPQNVYESDYDEPGRRF